MNLKHGNEFGCQFVMGVRSKRMVVLGSAFEIEWESNGIEVEQDERGNLCYLLSPQNSC